MRIIFHTPNSRDGWSFNTGINVYYFNEDPHFNACFGIVISIFGYGVVIERFEVKKKSMRPEGGA